MSRSFSPAYGAIPPQAILADGARIDGVHDVVTDEALALVAALSRAHGHSRDVLLAARRERRRVIARDGLVPGLLPETAGIRQAQWTVAPVPPDLARRRVEITAPADPTRLVSALNSGAGVCLADLDDAPSPTWTSVVGGHRALADAARGTLSVETEDGATRRPEPGAATLTVRPRRLHVPEPSVLVDGDPAAACVVDVALLALHLADALAARGSGLYLSLPTMDNHHEAQWWDAVLADAERRCALPANSIRVTVVIEHILAVLEMNEILFFLRDRITGLHAGRWGHLFSTVRQLATDHVLAERDAITMRAPFLSAYSARLVATCHRRGAYAIGDLSDVIADGATPATIGAAITELQNETRREAALGYDGTSVAHPDLVASVRETFDDAVGERRDQRAIIPPVGPLTELIDTRLFSPVRAQINENPR